MAQMHHWEKHEKALSRFINRTQTMDSADRRYTWSHPRMAFQKNKTSRLYLLVLFGARGGT
jgi:hypothetical protein